MLVPTTFLAALALLAAPAVAVPSMAGASVGADGLAARDAPLPKLVYAEAINGGLWTIYDDESKPLLNVTDNKPASTLDRRCGSNNIACDYVNFRANSRICGALMDIMGDPQNIARSVAPWTEQCFTATNVQDNNMCCITWSQRVAGLTVGMLFGAAGPMLSRCSRDELVSARATDVDLAGTCAVQCMSNRNSGCSW